MKLAVERKSEKMLPWKELVKQLVSLHQIKQRYRLLPYLELCCDALKNGEVDFADTELIEQIRFIISLFIKLDKIAHEKNYRKALGRNFIGQFISALQKQASNSELADLCELIKIKLPYLHDIAIKHARLCEPHANSLEDFLDANEDNPLKSLYELHEYFIAYAQEALEHLGEIVIGIRVVDYWQVLQLDNLMAFEKQSIAPLLTLGDHLLQLVKHSPDSVKKKEALRLVLLLQMLLWEHPEIKKLEPEEWAAESFVSSFFPYFADNLPSSMKLRPIGECVLLKDFRSQLQRSRALFSDKSNEILAVQRQHSEAVKSMLKEMFEAAVGVFGQPPAELLLCLLGSTARLDRRPYSDIEYLVLHSAVDERLKKEVDVYVGHVLSVFELMIVRLGETPINKAESVGRFSVDTSALKKKLWGTPQDMADRYVTGWMPERSAFHGHPYRRMLHVALPLLPEEDIRDVDTLYLVEENDTIAAHYTEEGKWCSSTKTKLALSKIITLNKKESEDNNEIAKVLAFFKTMPSDQWLAPQLYEYLEPVPINNDSLRKNSLIKEFRDHIEPYLQKMISEEDLSARVNHGLKWNVPNWWRGLNQGQAIALICLQDIVNESAKIVNKEFQPNQIINLKKVYYKPLVYFALNLKLLFGWKELVSPVEILQKYCEELKWGGEALFAWLKAALSFVTEMQVKMHLDAGYQKDDVNYSVDSEDEKISWAGLDLIGTAFIAPLEIFLKDIFEWSLSMEIIGYDLMKKYLEIRRGWLEKWTREGIGRDRLLQHPLICSLSSYPDASGWSPQMELMLKQHQVGILRLSTDRITPCEFAGLPVEEKQPPRYLNEEIQQECFKEGKFVGDPELSSDRSQVKKVIVGDKSWYIKVKEGNLEGLMAREYLVMMLHLLLGGKPQVALGWPIQLRSEYKGKIKFHYAWVSEGIGGDSLGKVMIKSPETLKAKNIDFESFTQLFLLTYLICPEDGQPENFKVIHQAGKVRLIAIDYGQSFVQLKRVAGFFKNKEALVMKTMIYFLESMDEDLCPDFIARLRLLDIDRWFQSWIDSAKAINAVFIPLLAKDPAVVSRSKQLAKPLCLIDVEDGLMLCVKKRLEILQHRLRTTDERITGRNILRACDRMVYLYYESLRDMIKTPKDFYQKLDKEAYEENAQGKIISSSSMRIIKEGTMAAGSLAQSCDLEPSYFRRINFGKLKKDDQQFSWELLESVAFRKGDQFFKLDLSGCEIDENRLIRLLEKMTNLQVLDLSDCKGIGVMTVAKLLAHRPDATLLTSNFKVLCPKLRAIDVTVEAKNSTLILNQSFEQRQLLTKKMRGLISISQRVVRALLNKASGQGMTLAIPDALWKLSEAGCGVTEDLFKALEDSISLAGSVVAALVLVRLGKSEDRMIDVFLKGLMDSADYRLGRLKKEVVLALIRIGKKDEDRVIEGLLEVLQTRGRHEHEDLELRISVIDALGRLGKAEDRVIVGLLKALEGRREELRISVVKALGRLEKAEDRVIDALLNMMGADERSVRNVVVEFLVKIAKANDREIEIMLKMLNGCHGCRYWRRVFVLMGKADDRVIEVLLAALGDSRQDIRYSAAEVLLQLGKADESVVKVLLRDFAGSEVLIESEAMALVQLIKADESVLKVCLDALGDSDYLVISQAEWVLIGIGKADDCVVDALLNLLKSSSRDIKKSAVTVLGRIGKASDGVINALLKTLGDSEQDVRYAGVEALGLIGEGEDRVIDALLEMLEISFGSDRRLVLEALVRLRNQDVRIIDAVLKAMESWADVYSVAGLRLFGNAKDRVIDKLLQLMGAWNKSEPVTKVLLKLGKENDCEIEVLLKVFGDAHALRYCATAFVPIEKADDRVIVLLFQALKDPDPIVRRYVALTLGQLGKAEDGAIEVLLTSLADPEESLRNKIVQVLVSLGKNENRVLERLLMVLREESELARNVAAQVLGGIGRAENYVIEGLLKALAYSQESVRNSAAQALGRIGSAENRVIDGLLRALSDHQKSVRKSAAQALRRVGKSEDRVIETLLKIVKGDAWESFVDEFEVLAELLNSKNCWKRIQDEVQLFPADNISFFGKSSLSPALMSDVDSLETFEVNEAALASQRAIINPALEQDQQINLLLKEGVLEPPEITETEDSQYSQAEKKSNGL